MGRKAIDRTGEERLNNFGSRMIIKEHRKYSDIDVYFPEYNWTAKHVQYNNFKKGTVKCPIIFRKIHIYIVTFPIFFNYHFTSKII